MGDGQDKSKAYCYMVGRERVGSLSKIFGAGEMRLFRGQGSSVVVLFLYPTLLPLFFVYLICQFVGQYAARIRNSTTRNKQNQIKTTFFRRIKQQQ
jgi:hypothetical protein